MITAYDDDENRINLNGADTNDIVGETKTYDSYSLTNICHFNPLNLAFSIPLSGICNAKNGIKNCLASLML